MPLQISMILFSETPVFAVEDWAAAVAANWPDLPVISDISEQNDTLSFRLDAADIAIGIMPAPIPWSDLEGPCATSVLWPDATSVVREHRSHAIVTVRGELLPVPLSTLLTQVTSALMTSMPASLGVFWTNAALLVPDKLFTAFAIDVMPHGPPLPIWIDCRVGWNEDNSHSEGFTTGLVELGLMELETQDATEQPVELKKRLEATAQYLLENGLVIKDGDTIGESAREKIRVIYSQSAFGAKDTVMRLVYESDSVKKPWWKPW